VHWQFGSPPCQYHAQTFRYPLTAACYIGGILNKCRSHCHSYLFLPLYWKQTYHTSKLTGEEWVKELINGHYDRMWTELGMHVHVFLVFVHELCILCGLNDSRNVGLNEQAAIFLYMYITGMSIRHVAERFQRSNETISKYVWVDTYSVNSTIVLN